jgi:hypothetical protein
MVMVAWMPSAVFDEAAADERISDLQLPAVATSVCPAVLVLSDRPQEVSHRHR